VGDTAFAASAGCLPMSGSAVQPTAGNLRLCRSGGTVFAADLGARLDLTAARGSVQAFAEAVTSNALLPTNYRAIQLRSALVTASGCSIVDRWPQSCTTSSFDPAIPSAIVRAAEMGVRKSSLPTTTSVGQ
jgi:hypothetical protein